MTDAVREAVRKATGLDFLGSGEKGGNLCYVNSRELREDFRTVFREEDAGYYLYALRHSSESLRAGRDLKGFEFEEIISLPSENVFWKMSGLGEELWRVHVNWEKMLFGSRYSLEGDGEWRVEEVRFWTSGVDGGVGEPDRLGRIYLNGRCNIGDVPECVWNFYVRGNYPAQVWLMERLGSTLSRAGQSVYVNLLSALARTASLVEDVDLTLGNMRLSE